MDVSATPSMLSVAGASGQAGTVLDAGYGATLDADAAHFAAQLERQDRAAAAAVPEAPGALATALFQPLEFLNTEAQSLVDYAEAAVSSGNELTPGEIVALTARSQEFMFHAQLTANVANRTADGLQQLFRQQS